MGRNSKDKWGVIAGVIARHFIQLFSTFFFERGRKQKIQSIKKARKLGVFRLFGREGGIRTLAPVHPTYSLSRGVFFAYISAFLDGLGVIEA